jgi:hypothetical protein
MSLVTAFRLAIAMVAIGLCVSSIQAQQPGGRFQGRGGPPGGGPGQERLQLLTNEAVQKDLELADDQKADLKKIAEDAQAQARALFGNFQGFRDLSEAEQEKRRAEMREKGEAMGKEVLKKVQAVLLPHQMDRLQEIFIQVRGTDALSDAEIAKQLAITEEQKGKLEAVRDEIRQKMFQGGQGGQQDREAAMARFAALRKEREEKSLAVLTSTQKEQFEKMKGEKFDIEAAGLRQGFGFGGFGGRPGGGRPGQGNQGNQPRTRPGGNNNNTN